MYPTISTVPSALPTENPTLSPQSISNEPSAVVLVPVTPYPTSLGWAPHPDESEEWSSIFSKSSKSKPKSKSSKIQKSSKSANVFDSSGGKDVFGGESSTGGWDESVSDVSYQNTLWNASGTAHWRKETRIPLLTIAMYVSFWLF